MELENITGPIIEASILIHRGLGSGVFESVYETVLASRLRTKSRARKGKQAAPPHR